MGVCIPMKKPNDCDYCKLYTDRYGEDLGIDFYCIVKDVQSDACPLIDIVTCGECKYYYPYKHYDGRILGYHCQAPNQQTDFLEPTHYCGFGERKTDEGAI